jgi:hypothetical protein
MLPEAASEPRGPLKGEREWRAISAIAIGVLH